MATRGTCSNLLFQNCLWNSIQLNLAPISSDDDVWFNGFYVGGLQGAYKYRNMLNRQYTVPASYIKYGSTNTLVICTWGGNFGLFGANSGMWPAPTQ